MQTLSSQLLKHRPVQIGYSPREQLAIAIKRRMLEDIMMLKTMVPVSELAISRLTDSRMEENAKEFALAQIRYMYDKIRDMHVLSMVLRNHPYLAFLDEETVEDIRKVTRKLIGDTLPTLRADMSTLKREQKTYANIAIAFKNVEQSVSRLDLYLIQYSAEVEEE